MTLLIVIVTLVVLMGLSWILGYCHGRYEGPRKRRMVEICERDSEGELQLLGRRKAHWWER